MSPPSHKRSPSLVGLSEPPRCRSESEDVKQQRQGSVTEPESHHLIMTVEAKFNSTVQSMKTLKRENKR